jgi:hypothetical protein
MQVDTNQLRKILIEIAKKRETTNYKELAEQLSFTPPNTIAQVTELLEACQEDDALLGRPQIVAVVIQKSGAPYPRSGFFQKLVELNLYKGNDSGTEAEMWHQNELEKVFNYYK